MSPEPRPGMERPARMPVIFAAHGAPVLLDDAAWMAELAAWAKAMPRPESILMVSAHWEERPTTLGATRTVPLVYDFYGFPERYYETRYPAPGAPELAARVRELLDQREIAHTDEPERGLDHGAYVPLVAMYPAADVPVLQISMPRARPGGAVRARPRARAAARRGRAGVRQRLPHPQHALRVSAGHPAVGAGVRRVGRGRAARASTSDALLDFRRRAPAAATALPTWEHYAPLLVAAGAVADGPRQTRFPITGCWMDGAFTKRSVQFG